MKKIKSCYDCDEKIMYYYNEQSNSINIKQSFIGKHRYLIVAVFFVMYRGKNMEFYMNKDKSIMCPNCHKFLTKADSKDPRTHKLACKHCRKWIWYVPNDDDNFQIKEIPDSRSSSGMTFY